MAYAFEPLRKWRVERPVSIQRCSGSSGWIRQRGESATFHERTWDCNLLTSFELSGYRITMFTYVYVGVIWYHALFNIYMDLYSFTWSLCCWALSLCHTYCFWVSLLCTAVCHSYVVGREVNDVMFQEVICQPSFWIKKTFPPQSLSTEWSLQTFAVDWWSLPFQRC